MPTEHGSPKGNPNGPRLSSPRSPWTTSSRPIPSRISLRSTSKMKKRRYSEEHVPSCANAKRFYAASCTLKSLLAKWEKSSPSTVTKSLTFTVTRLRFPAQSFPARFRFSRFLATKGLDLFQRVQSLRKRLDPRQIFGDHKLGQWGLSL